MRLLSRLESLQQELESPRDERRFGSGWISGSLALLAGIVGLLMVIVLRNPSLTSVPELARVHESSIFKLFIYFTLISGFSLAALSMLLRKTKTLGSFAMVATLAATMIGSLPSHRDLHVGGIFFGLDFFVLNVLFTGFLFIPIERIVARNSEQHIFRQEWREDLFYYLVSSLLVQVLTYLTLAPSNFIVHSSNLDAVRQVAKDLPFVVQIVVIMFLTDFVQYWLHRAFHRVPFLWNFHAVHHSARSMDWIAGARMHFLEIIALRSVTATPMLVIGFDEAAIQTYMLIVYVYSTFIHANIGTNFGALEKLFVFPRFHHWHHGIDRDAIDVNFAIHFPFIDRMFGTHHLPESKWPSSYGIEGHPVPLGYWQQLLYPFRAARR